MISIIIPVLNEARALPATLDAISAQPGNCEVIVVDAASEDTTVSVAASYPGVQILQSARGRAVQMNTGARHAQGDWLLFLHADTQLPDAALVTISALNSAAQAGGFKHRFANSGPLLGVISWLDNWRCARTRVFFGDQALFIRRALFVSMGGFPEQQILEDVYFSRRLVDHYTRPVLLDLTVTTDARKFREMGVLRSFWRIAVILTCLELDRPIPKHALRFFHNVR